MTTVAPKELKNALQNDKDTLVLDVREPHEHSAEHIPNVYNLPLCDIEKHAGDIAKYKKVYLHCQSGRRSEAALKILQEKGINAAHLPGGIQEWKDAGESTRRPGKRLPIMRQVLLIAGLLVLTGSLLSFVSFNWIALPLFVSCGLIFAGATGHCFMAQILGYMPWNKATKTTLPWE